MPIRRSGRAVDGADTSQQLDDFIVWVALGIVLGGRIGYVLFYDLQAVIENPCAHFRSGTAACPSMAA